MCDAEAADRGHCHDLGDEDEVARPDRRRRWSSGLASTCTSSRGGYGASGFGSASCEQTMTEPEGEGGLGRRPPKIPAPPFRDRKGPFVISPFPGATRGIRRCREERRLEGEADLGALPESLPELPLLAARDGGPHLAFPEAVAAEAGARRAGMLHPHAQVGKIEAATPRPELASGTVPEALRMGLLRDLPLIHRPLLIVRSRAPGERGRPRNPR